VDNNEWKANKGFIQELKYQWRLLWMERIDDKVRAEGIAGKDFSLLFVERGTVIIATRDYKPLDFRQILQQHKLAPEDNFFPNPTVGGWGKFAREVFGKNRRNRRQQFLEKPQCSNGPLKKGGRGWLHARL
jgi:hypothetical protein